MEPTINDFIRLCDHATKCLEDLSSTTRDVGSRQAIKDELLKVADKIHAFVTTKETESVALRVDKAIAKTTSDPGFSLDAIKVIDQVKGQICRKKLDELARVDKKELVLDLISQLEINPTYKDDREIAVINPSEDPDCDYEITHFYPESDPRLSLLDLYYVKEKMKLKHNIFLAKGKYLVLCNKSFNDKFGLKAPV